MEYIINQDIKELKEKYKGQKGRTRKDDTQRQKDNNKRVDLNKKLSEKKDLRKEYLNKLKVYDY